MVPPRDRPTRLLQQPRSRTPRSRHAQALFAEAARDYDRIAERLSYGQYSRWQSRLVQAARGHGVCQDTTVLDVACGTGKISLQLAHDLGCPVVGIDLTDDMLRHAQAKLHAGAPGSRRHRGLVQGTADRLPFPDDSFDALTFSYLYRYVEDPRATTAELLRVVRPGGFVGFIEFHVPPHPFWFGMWRLHTRVGLPAAGRLHGRGWGQVGAFLGPNIETFYRDWDVARLRRLWHDLGVTDVHAETPSLGGALVMWGRRT